MEKNTYSEIDLVAVLRSLISKIKRHRVRYFLVIGAFVGIALVFYLVYPKRYNLILVGSSRSLKVEALTGMTEVLNTAARDRDYELLGSTLRISPAKAAEIIGVEIKQIKPDILIPNATGGEGYFELKVVTSSLVDEDSLQIKMMRYFEANPTVALRVEARRRMWKNMMQQTKLEIAKLEAMRDDLFKGKAGDPKFIMVEPGKINQTIIDLYRAMYDYEYELTTVHEFSVLQGFMSPRKAAFPRLGVTLFVGLLAGIILGFFVILERED
ncbi:MAG: hypothetical protein U0289_17475 [Cyclobacteriaceae bacterium]|jgi:hypothetical protein|nr:hypothetical protein [Cyclobacteriaceae bacterium]